jgi:hypothetical protein
VRKTFLCAVLRIPAAAAAVALASGPAGAHAVFEVCRTNDACGLAQAIDDEQMAAVAGKFTIAGEVVGMNLTMTSSWQAANGQRLEASAALSIALPGSGQAGAHFDARASATEGQIQDVQTQGQGGTVHQGSGLQSVRGVAQVIQVAGNGNGAANQAAVHVTGDNVLAAGGNGLLGASYTASNGAQASVNIANNGMTLHLLMPDAGSAGQQVNLAGMGNIHQNIQIAAHGHHVVNQMQLQLQMQPATSAALAAQGLAGSLNMLRGR